jgi:hypothetical protein
MEQWAKGLEAEYSQLRRAILRRQLVKCLYKGLECELCPYAIGLKNGWPHLLALQVGGKSWDSTSGNGNWHCIPIYQLINIAVYMGEWRRGKAPAPKEMCLDLVELTAPVNSPKNNVPEVLAPAG